MQGPLTDVRHGSDNGDCVGDGGMPVAEEVMAVAVVACVMKGGGIRVEWNRWWMSFGTIG